jgi:PAS domain S-box-containing protein
VDARELVQSGLLGEAIDDAPVLVFVADENRRYVAVNRYACTLLGYERDELLGLSVDEVARYEEAEGEYAGMVARGAADGVSVLSRKDGSTFSLLYRASVVTVARMELYVSVGWPVAG